MVKNILEINGPVRETIDTIEIQMTNVKETGAINLLK